MKTIGLDSNFLNNLMLINFMLNMLDQFLKQKLELLLEKNKVPDLDLFRKFSQR